MREDTFTRTVEDAATYERIRGGSYDDPDLPSLSDVGGDGGTRPRPAAPLPPITETVKTVLVRNLFEPRPLATLGDEGEAAAVCVFVVRPGDDDARFGDVFAAVGLEHQILDGTCYVRRFDPWRTTPVSVHPPEPPF